MRIGIIALLHESNTFVSQPTTIDSFRANTLLTGDAIRDTLADSHHEIGGFFAGLTQEASERGVAIDAVPLLAARALPTGPVTTAAFDELRRMMFEQLDSAGELDGLLVAPHGATVSEPFPDADGQWLSELRDRVGPDMPIIGTLDAHANLSSMMVDSCHALVVYRTNPHLDQRQRGIEAARLIVRTVAGEITPTMAASFPPLAINIERQLTSEPHLTPLFALADQQLSHQSVLSNSILLGFPYADVEEMGSAAIVVTDNDPALAERLAGELGAWMWDHRQDFVADLISVDEALDRCESLDGPVCLLDMGDNVGGGSTADGTTIAHAIHARRAGGAFVCIFDPESVERATAAGPGNNVDLTIGGKCDNQHGDPLCTRVVVRSLHEGRFHEPEVRHGGMSEFDQGPTAIVETGQGLTIMLTSKRMVPFSLNQFSSCGLDPASFHILVAKGVNAPVAAYREVCPHLIRVNTPGSTCADMTELAFHRRRMPLFPFELNADWVQ